ncbi:hypothetical protein IMCC3135_32000 [Granulosicoccus antarcticus IMCC3135]|uniref:Resolvase/invertase-type recombinase catalytic domain-containing protein n=1 Tax=Granulosicoccus antarcticus IMCC3135 TaxID=1192854 RepID=A0A2Z2P6Y3_9GAMM|nr:recombinase family protein [Granulosicoccus antarcticus]ASJ76447.1 hypothetical protein IMCC3135_32000 [Granulosicoccus antarcticus IMCC3135]
MLAHLCSRDTLHMHSIDRLAKNLADLLKLIESITGKGVAVQFHNECHERPPFGEWALDISREKEWF